MSVQYIKLSQTHLRTTEMFSAVTHARMKSHITSDMECVTILYKISVQWVKLSPTHFWKRPSFSRQLLVRIVNITLLLIRSVSRFSTWYWPHSGGHLYLKWVPSLANCVDIPSRPQGPVNEAFAFLWMGSRLPRKVRRYHFKTTRTSRRSISQCVKATRWPGEMKFPSFQNFQYPK